MKNLYACYLQLNFLRVCSPFLPWHFCTTYLLYCPHPFFACFVQQKLWSFSSIGCHLLPVLHWLSCFYYVEYAQEKTWDLLNMNCCNKRSSEHLKQLIKSTWVWGGTVSGQDFFFFLGVTKHCAFNLDDCKHCSSDGLVSESIWFIICTGFLFYTDCWRLRLQDYIDAVC